MHVEADVGGSSFYEVTFQRKVGNGRWHVDRHRRHRAVPGLPRRLAPAPGTPLQYRAVVLDNAGHTRASGVRSTRRCRRRAITMSTPTDGGTVANIDPVTVTATVDPERAAAVGRASSAASAAAPGPASAPTRPRRPTPSTDDVSGLPLGTTVRYRAILTRAGPPGRSPAPR